MLDESVTHEALEPSVEKKRREEYLSRLRERPRYEIDALTGAWWWGIVWIFHDTFFVAALSNFSEDCSRSPRLSLSSLVRTYTYCRRRRTHLGNACTVFFCDRQVLFLMNIIISFWKFLYKINFVLIFFTYIMSIIQCYCRFYTSIHVSYSDFWC